MKSQKFLILPVTKKWFQICMFINFTETVIFVNYRWKLSKKLFQLITSPSNFSISNFGKQTFVISEFWKDKSLGKLLDTAFLYGFDKCKSMLNIAYQC